MATPNSNITHVAVSQAQKEVTINQAFDQLDNLVNGNADIDVSVTPILATADWEGFSTFTITAVGAGVLTIPNRAKNYLVNNTTGSGLTLDNGTTTVVAPGGAVSFIASDGAGGIAVVAGGGAATAASQALGDPFYTETPVLSFFNGNTGDTTYTTDDAIGRAVTFVTATISDAQSKFGGTSLICTVASGAEPPAHVPHTVDQDITGDFTIEGWMWFTSINSAESGNTMMSKYSNSGANRSWAFMYDTGSGGLRYLYSADGSSGVAVDGGSWTPNLLQWYHLAVSRVDGEIRLFIDGVQSGSTTTDATNPATVVTTVDFGALRSSAGFRRRHLGHLDDVRLSMVGRYSTNFTPIQASKVVSTNTDVVEYVLSDETTSLTTGDVLTIRTTRLRKLQGITAYLTTASTAGNVVLDIKKNTTSILSTQVSIDATEDISDTAATPPVISEDNIGGGAKLTFEITGAGASATGLKVQLRGLI